MFEELPFWSHAQEVMNFISPPPKNPVRPDPPTPKKSRVKRNLLLEEAQVITGGVEVFDGPTETDITETRVPALSRAQKQTILCSLEYTCLTDDMKCEKFVRENYPGLCSQKHTLVY